MLKTLVIIAALLLAHPLSAQDKSFSLQAPAELVETGFLKHLLPRFSLKTGIRITLGDDAGDAAFGAEGTPVFRQGETVWHYMSNGTPHPVAFQDWLLSDVGQRTIESFERDGAPLFSADVAVKEDAQVAVLSGDAALGEELSLSKCGRCHVVNEKNRMDAIGSTPSFALMRSFPDWQERFETFYVLRPHGAFTQVTDVTDPFPDNLPSPISPIEVTLEQIESITAYVGSIAPADLGAPIGSQ